MAFDKKTWQNRLSQYPTRRTLTDISTGTVQTVTVARAEGTIQQNGDSFDASTMNDLENRIEAAIQNNYVWNTIDTPEVEEYSDPKYLFIENLELLPRIKAGDIFVIHINQARNSIADEYTPIHLVAYVGTAYISGAWVEYNDYVLLGTLQIYDASTDTMVDYSSETVKGDCLVLRASENMVGVNSISFEVLGGLNDVDVVGKNIHALQYGVPRTGGSYSVIETNTVTIAKDERTQRNISLDKKPGTIVFITFVDAVKMADSAPQNSVYYLQLGGSEVSGTPTDIRKADLPNGFKHGETYAFAYQVSYSGYLQVSTWKLLSSSDTNVGTPINSYIKPNTCYVEFDADEINTVKRVLIASDKDYRGYGLLEDGEGDYETTSEYLSAEAYSETHFEQHGQIIEIVTDFYADIQFTNDAFEYGEVIIPNAPVLDTGSDVITYDANNDLHIIVRKRGDGGGTTVVANPSGTATDDLEKIQIGSTIYDIPGGGGSGQPYICDLLFQNTQPPSPTSGTSNVTRSYELSDEATNYDIIIFIASLFNSSSSPLANTETGFISKEMWGVNYVTLNGSFGGAELQFYFAKGSDDRHVSTTVIRSISDVEPMLMKVYGLKFTSTIISPVVYSTTEQEIGVYSDGKPLYQRTYIFNTPIEIESTWEDTDIDSSDFDNVVYALGIHDDGTCYNDVSAGWSGSDRTVLQLKRYSGGSAAFKKLILQYTKLSDTPGSGTWSPEGYYVTANPTGEPTAVLNNVKVGPNIYSIHKGSWTVADGVATFTP